MASERRSADDRGTVMMLVPAGILVLLMLAAMTFDFAHLHLAQREAAGIAESIANDAATAAIDQGALRAGRGVALTQERVDRVAAVALADPPSDLRIVSLDARLDPGSGSVTVTVVGQVDPVFLRTVPGEIVSSTVRATATATLHS